MLVISCPMVRTDPKKAESEVSEIEEIIIEMRGSGRESRSSLRRGSGRENERFTLFTIC